MIIHYIFRLKPWLCVCVCVCMCVHACVRACVCVCETNIYSWWSWQTKQSKTWFFTYWSVVLATHLVACGFWITKILLNKHHADILGIYALKCPYWLFMSLCPLIQNNRIWINMRTAFMRRHQSVSEHNPYTGWQSYIRNMHLIALLYDANINNTFNYKHKL